MGLGISGCALVAVAFNRALWCLSFVSGISLSADLSVLGFAGGLGLVLSLSRSPRLRPSGLSDCRRGAGHSSRSASELRPYVFVPLLSGGPGDLGSLRAGRAVDLRSTHVAVSVTGLGPFPCSSTCLSRQFSGPVRSHALLSERNESLLPIGDRGKAAPGAVAGPVANRTRRLPPSARRTRSLPADTVNVRLAG